MKVSSGVIADLRKPPRALRSVAVAAFYPDISLSAAFGDVGSAVSSLVDTANKVWSLGGAAGESVFDTGSRRLACEFSRCVAGINSYTVPIGVLYAKKMMSKKRFIRDLSCRDSPTD
jgi:hypothetical protein